jgi:lipopolysaccharide transport system permease protein
LTKRNILLIEPGLSSRNYWRELWRYRELFLVLARRDISVRYKQTVIGVGWALIRPFLTMVVFTVIFGKVARLPTDGGEPYALMVFAGLLPWQFFSTSLSEAAGSLIGNTSLVTKVYFPRVIVPIATMVVSFLDFLVSFGVLVGVMAWYRFVPTWRIAALPLFVAMAFLASLGPGLWVTSLNVRYRDFRYVIPFVVQLGLYVSPVAYSSSVVPGEWKFLYALNPMVGVIDGFRWSILGGPGTQVPTSIVPGGCVILLLLWLGFRQFRRMEGSFADLI